MNLPNRLTLLRILLVPVCLILAGLGYYWWAAALFLVAGLTDLLDGYLARKKHLITDFGKFADPIADKILVLSMSIMLTYKGFLPVWLPIILVFRELAVDGLRLIAIQQGKVVAAGWSGKIKTTCQMILIIYVLVFQGGVLMLPASILVAILTVYSGAEYFWKLRGLFKKDLGL
ncbi:MAG: CDP-diacylglycerol--glycerol-3-phosphate 3-phosphatidyltransferase [Clostridia bacterium]|nr:CDP-diacylglycerol--glycerol-3-phosphate 3-phosphatidyltransferase [Clostridia bacterium]MBR5382902.1 CDP-diacylglycerol--glycerol-3-phosphate 3-phosphatidyltransferase [Clostridia bacterium]